MFYETDCIKKICYTYSVKGRHKKISVFLVVEPIRGEGVKIHEPLINRTFFTKGKNENKNKQNMNQ